MTVQTAAHSIVIRRRPADLDTPVGVLLKTQSISGARFLLESVEGGAARGRYSVIGLKPHTMFTADAHSARICRMEGARVMATEARHDVMASMRQFIASAQMPLPEGIPAMAAGVYGYLGYDTIRHIEAIPDPMSDPLQLPEIILIRPSLIIIFDHVMEELLLCASVWAEAGHDLYLAQTLLDEAEAALDHPVPHGNYSTTNAQAEPIVPHSNVKPSEYMACVARVKEYIAAGDIFQAVISQRFEMLFEHHPFSFYRALRKTNPAPYLFYFDFDDFQIEGSSPEILVRLKGDRVTIRPIAGTRKRGATPAEDNALASDLLSDPKERAEHLMLLDLGRNDVGKVAQMGSVTVTDQFFLEYYSHVMHIVSNVEGKIAPEYNAVDAYYAGFPAGTVSGAPKVRAMEIINELEPVKRGVYGGGVGYFSANGDMDTCIALRTAVIKSGRIYIQAGAGIVADSIAESEQAECENKARALVEAAGIAARFGMGQT